MRCSALYSMVSVCVAPFIKVSFLSSFPSSRRRLLRHPVGDASDVGNQLHEVFLADMALKGRHIVRVARNNVLRGQKNGVANVSFVGGHNLAGLQWHGMAEDPLQRRRTHGGAVHMAAAAD